MPFYYYLMESKLFVISVLAFVYVILIEALIKGLNAHSNKKRFLNRSQWLVYHLINFSVSNSKIQTPGFYYILEYTAIKNKITMKLIKYNDS